MAEVESEFGLSLSEKGYEYLKRVLKWDRKSKRADFYFDLFDNSEFLLSQTPQWKWRLKTADGLAKGEISQLISQKDISSAGITMRISNRMSSHGSTKGKSLDALLSESAVVIDFLRTSNKSVAREAISSVAKPFNRELQKLQFFPELVSEQLQDSNSAFAIPAYWNRKKRRGVFLEFKHTDLSIFIEKKSLLDKSGNAIFSYALEAEPDMKLDPKLLKATGLELIEFLSDVKLSQKHLNFVSADPWAFVRARLTSAKMPAKIR